MKLAFVLKHLMNKRKNMVFFTLGYKNASVYSNTLLMNQSTSRTRVKNYGQKNPFKMYREKSFRNLEKEKGLKSLIFGMCLVFKRRQRKMFIEIKNFSREKKMSSQRSTNIVSYDQQSRDVNHQFDQSETMSIGLISSYLNNLKKSAFEDNVSVSIHDIHQLRTTKSEQQFKLKKSTQVNLTQIDLFTQKIEKIELRKIQEGIKFSFLKFKLKNIKENCRVDRSKLLLNWMANFMKSSQKQNSRLFFQKIKFIHFKQSIQEREESKNSKIPYQLENSNLQAKLQAFMKLVIYKSI